MGFGDFAELGIAVGFWFGGGIAVSKPDDVLPADNALKPRLKTLAARYLHGVLLVTPGCVLGTSPPWLNRASRHRSRAGTGEEPLYRMVRRVNGCGRDAGERPRKDCHCVGPLLVAGRFAARKHRISGQNCGYL